MNPLAPTVWNTLYPDRRPWDQLEPDTQAEWSRMVDVASGLVLANNKALRAAMNAAMTEFCREGSDGAIAANMFKILGDALNAECTLPQ